MLLVMCGDMLCNEWEWDIRWQWHQGCRAVLTAKPIVTLRVSWAGN